MKKSYVFAIALLLIIFISGCRGSIGNGNGNVATTTTFREQQPGTYTLKVGEGIAVDGKSIKVVEVSSANGLVALSVDGDLVEFPITRLHKVVRTLEIQTIRVDYGRTPQDHSATIDVQLFQLGQNEFYMKADEVITVGGTQVKLRDLTNNDGARLSVNTQDELVQLGETKAVMNLIITHKKAFDDPVKANRYAVLEIKSV